MWHKLTQKNSYSLMIVFRSSYLQIKYIKVVGKTKLYAFKICNWMGMLNQGYGCSPVREPSLRLEPLPSV